VWLYQDSRAVLFGPLKSRLRDQYVQHWNIAINSSPKLDTYITFKYVNKCELYLQCVNTVSHRIAFTQLRVSSHNPFIETGRYSNVARNMRLCTKCNMSVVESEYHFLLVCPFYSDLRNTYLTRYYCHWPNLHKFVSLLSTTNKKLLINLAKFVYYGSNAAMTKLFILSVCLSPNYVYTSLYSRMYMNV
jgi:hypothetical protein